MKPALQSLLRLGLTAAIVILSLFLGRGLWNHYMYSPWTRDARMRAEVVRIAPDVSGLVIRVAVVDNQEVRKGEVLYEIDPARFRFALQQAEASLTAAKANARAAGANIDAVLASAEARKTEYDMRQEQATRRQALADVVPKEERNNAKSVADSAMAAWHEAQASGHQAGAAREQALAAVALAQVATDTAKLDLERTQVRAPVDGYVTNLTVRTGDYAASGNASMALIDRHGYYVYGYFEETKLPRLHVGDPVDIRLMSGGAHVGGRITGFARGITDRDNPTGSDLLADVNPTFTWVRLAQRVPVRIAIDEASVPRGVILAAGMTATVTASPL
ncbi:efflux transporter periplasmic adaptor subunit [Luteibacter rhizovicinus DSM 16549]|uniref:Efflux transporter periplasmic adaptor subunit n=1 Tax=Luteibacter rhizovicinus DSM 16549 TaxID=1440763 RepID=A0A0G9HJT9_9GAMM|nr:HlyD family secretion protein [Luteibacter rhizovicinus]APG05341.1 efflux transporter periplasmic adaptor subunit [Luteibacter rhizovicinus DSM 16549]KLD67962.1 membrane protein [Luteibacter rhizovicinus DSM 16549]KLD73014.1 membrane protein [Xanthomonas hyacinthi DSM 19077]